ncbi:hypothetical protein EYR38_003168 [Pleurotus pulmonarius]|nr:hypothetical protein EYR38_003168 [Pleurotus pulmonarius]
MADFESLFNSSILKVSVPDTSIEFPPKGSTDEWLARLNSGSAERKQAFFDEQLHALVTLRINLPLSDTPVSQDKPPPELLSFLAHLQTTVEATYISSVPTTLPDTLDTTRLSAPPRTGSLGLKITPRPGSQHPSIYPPNTPNPTPLTADHDRKYVQAEGTLLMASIWGQSSDEDSGEAFCLLWSEEEQAWVAVYRLGVRISFVSLKFDDPLLCLTVSETLREKPIPLHQYPKHPLAGFLAAHGAAIASSTEAPLPSPRDEPAATDGNELSGLDEANILEGLACGPTYYTLSGNANGVTLPTTRLGIVTRRKLFSLAPTSLPSPVAPSPSPLTALRTTHPTLRKSFRRTLGTASGFRVRMRTVFVPAVMLDEEDEEEGASDDPGEGEHRAAVDTSSDEDSSEDSEDEEKAAEQKDLRESGNEERTVILSVEVENSGDSGPGVLFEVENVDVRIGGEGARSRLIGWGDADAKRKEESKFPIRIESMGQYNLLYAVSFLKTPNDMDGFSLSRDPSVAGAHNPELQRAVSITVYGRPIVPTGTNKDGVYPTETFSSRWNCVLDLSASAANAQDPSAQRPNDLGASSRFKDTLPEPPSPFPMSFSGARSPLPLAKGSGDNSDRRASVPIRSPTSASIGGLGIAGLPKRHSLPGSQPGRIPSASAGWRSSTSMLNPGYQPTRDLRPPNPISPGAGSSNANNRLSYMPPSVTVGVQNARSPTTYNAPYMAAAAAAPFASSNFEGNDDTRVTSPISIIENGGMPPPTPAYPSYPSPSGLPVPPSQNPIVSQNSGNVGPKIDVKRAKGVGLGVTLQGTPSPGGAVGGSNTPLPLVPGAFGEQTMLKELQRAEESREAVVVSVGMLPVKRKHSLADALGGSSPDDQEEEGKGTGPGKIYPLETFTLDIFVFNQSAWTRRLEVSFPDRRTVRKGALSDGARFKDWNGDPGILALDNRVRVGPLRPSTCQSVRMEFLALSPGVHSVDTLTLTDVESGISMNLRCFYLLGP